MLPPGSDCVIPVERITTADGWTDVDPDVVAEPFGNVHTRGLDCRDRVELGLRYVVGFLGPEMDEPIWTPASEVEEEDDEVAY